MILLGTNMAEKSKLMKYSNELNEMFLHQIMFGLKAVS